MKYIIRLKGGKGSGFHGHQGRPGFVGGSKKISGNSIRGYKPQDKTSPFNKLPSRGFLTNVDFDNTAAYVPSWGKDEHSRQSDYHPESQQYAWIYPSSYMNILPESYSRGINTTYDRKTIQDLKDRMKKRRPMDPVSVDINIETGEVMTQEGRHRAMAASELDIGRIPLIIYYRMPSGKYVDLKDYTEEQINSVSPIKNLEVRGLVERI